MTHPQIDRSILLEGIKSDLRKRLFRISGPVNGMLKVKLGRPALKLLLLIVSVLGLRKNLGVVKVLITYLAYVHGLYRKGGARFTIIYLKACSTLLQQAIGGQVLPDTKPFGARVSRTRGGLPRVIPALHRASIRRGNLLIIRLWLSLFALYRVIDLVGKVDLSSISAPSTADMSLLGEWSDFVTLFWAECYRLYNKKGSIVQGVMAPCKFLSNLTIRPFLTTSTGPILSGSLTKEEVSSGIPSEPARERRAKPEPAKFSSSSPLAIIMSAHLWRFACGGLLRNAFLHWAAATWNLPWFENLLFWSRNYTSKLSKLVDGFGRGTTYFNPKSGKMAQKGDLSERQLQSKDWKKVKFSICWWMGKLGFKQEAAGKVRVFAMVDIITQWVMRPLHNAIALLLELIPQDGTFDQLKPIVRLLELQSRIRKGDRSRKGRVSLSMKTALFSFDLSSATDRLPVIFQKALLSPVISIAGAEHWAYLLVGRAYLVPTRKEFGLRRGFAPSEVKYAAGQPMGALSSWAMLALTHHCIVQWSWYRVCKHLGRSWGWYDGYAILGDDVVIMGTKVAKEYVKIVRALGVNISEHKSLVSKSGLCLEFAKRTFLRGENVSAVPLLELQSSSHNLGMMIELVRKYSLTLGQYLSFLGFGYRAKASASGVIPRLPKRLRNFLVLFYGPGSLGFPGILKWLSLKTQDSSYKISKGRLEELSSTFLRREKRRLLDALDLMGQMFRSCEGMWGPPALVDEEGYALPGQSVKFPGVSSFVDDAVLLDLNQQVFVGMKNKAMTRAWELQAKVMMLREPQVADLDALWQDLREIEELVGALPLPSDSVVAKARKELSRPRNLQLWEAYSQFVRTTSG